MSGISSGLFAEDWYEECEETRQQAAQAAIRYIDIYSIYFNRGSHAVFVVHTKVSLVGTVTGH